MKNEKTTTACNLTNMPTFQFYTGGQKVDEMTGADADKLRALVEKHWCVLNCGVWFVWV